MVDNNKSPQHEEDMDTVTDADAHQSDHAITDDSEMEIGKQQEGRPGTEEEEEQSGSGESFQDEGDGDEGAAGHVGSGPRKPDVWIRPDILDWPVVQDPDWSGGDLTDGSNQHWMVSLAERERVGLTRVPILMPRAEAGCRCRCTPLLHLDAGRSTTPRPGVCLG